MIEDVPVAEVKRFIGGVEDDADGGEYGLLPLGGNAVNLRVKPVFLKYKTSSFCVSPLVQSVFQVVLMLCS